MRLQARRFSETGLVALLSINSLSRSGANEVKKLMLTPGGRGTGPTLARDRHRLAAVLSITFLSRNSPNQLKKLMLTPGGGGRSTSRRGRKILVPQPWELETFAPGMRWPETG